MRPERILVTGANGQLAQAILAAFAFVRWRFAFDRVLYTLIAMTWLVPFQVIMIPNYVLAAQLGLINTVTALILPHLASAFAILLLVQAMRSFPNEIMEAAHMDGAGHWRILWRIVVPNLRAPLAAWLQQLDMYADRFGLPLDINAERAKYQLPALTLLEVSEHTNVGVLSVLQFARLPFDRLSDQQLIAAFKRATLIQHKGSLRPLLMKIVERPGTHEHLEIARVYRFLSDLSALLSEPEEAIRWLDKERSRSVPATEKFEHDLDCDMRELRYRLDDPHGSDCNNLLRRMWEHYAVKVPELRAYVTGIVSHYNVSAPWMSEESTGAITSGGVWTPDSAAEKPAGESKLWIPGS